MNFDNYEVSDFYMVRNPVLSFDKYKEILEKEDVYKTIMELFEKEPVIREAILVSSKSLYDSLLYKNGDKDKVINSFLKYYIRMCTRTTPYGLFTGVTTGKFSKITGVRVENKKVFVKRARVDSEWLLKLIKNLENDKEILFNLNVKATSSILEKGERLENKLVINYGKSNRDIKTEGNSISYTSLVRIVLDMAKENINLKELLSMLYTNLPQLPKDKIEKFLFDLVEKEYLMTNLRPCFEDYNMLNTLINNLDNIDLNESKDIIYKLKEINELINDYNRTEVGQGEKVLNEIYTKMQNVVRCKNYLQIDMKSSGELITIDHDIRNKIKEFAEVVNIANKPASSTDNLENYLRNFMEKYSEGQEVPLLELIDESLGIGFPKVYKNISASDNEYATNNMEKITKLINIKLTSNVNKENEPIIISTEEFEALNLDKIEEKDTLESFELNFILSREKNDINISLGPNFGSYKVGKMFGRFLDILDDSTKKSLENTINSIYVNDEDTIYADISEMHPQDRSLNVTKTPLFLDYKLLLGFNERVTSGKKSIRLDDLLIGCCNESFYIKSKSLNKKIVFRSFNMLNLNGTHPIYRLLLDISNDNKGIEFFSLLVQQVNSMVYNPRLQINDIIVVPETWKISSSILGLNKKCRFSEFVDIFKVWKNENRVKNFVYLSAADNRLLINTEDSNHLKVLWKELEKGGVFKLEELIGDFNKQGLVNNEENYATEIVVPIVRKYLVKENSVKNFTYISQYNAKRIFLPLDQWFYVKVYVDKNREEEFISTHLNKFINSLKNEGLIEKSFFIRYRDEKNHIRIRMLKSQNSESELNLAYTKFLKEMFEKKLVNDAAICTYTREIERYGGCELIESAEDIFQADSELVIKILELKNKKMLNMDDKIIGVIVILKFLEDFGINYNQQLMYFDSFIRKDEYKKEFNIVRKELINLTNPNNDWNNLKKGKQGELLFSLLENRTKVISSYASNLKEIEKQNLLTNNIESIIGAFLHMFCNKFYGTNRKIEKEVFSYTRHTLYALKYFIKQT